MDMRGQGLSMSVLVIAAIAVVVLLLVGVFFTGGFRKIGTSLIGFADESVDQEGAANATACNIWCMNNATGMRQDDPKGCSARCP